LNYLTTRRGDSAEDTEFFADNPVYNEDVLDGLETLFQTYVTSNDTKKLSRARIEDINAFHAFVILCLRHTIGVMTWKLKHRKVEISELFSISDEALALVILENNAQLWKDKARGAIPLTDKAKGGRYMKKSKNGSVRKDWSDEGMERFNEVFCQVRELRLTSLSATNERTLKASWNRLMRNRGRGETVQSPDDNVGTHRGGRVTFIYEG
jgi:hypothetical protein